jgi:hypothetical protein
MVKLVLQRKMTLSCELEVKTGGGHLYHITNKATGDEKTHKKTWLGAEVSSLVCPAKWPWGTPAKECGHTSAMQHWLSEASKEPCQVWMDCTRKPEPAPTGQHRDLFNDNRVLQCICVLQVLHELTHVRLEVREGGNLEQRGEAM